MLGQGSNFALPGIDLTTSKAIKSQFDGQGRMLACVGDVQSEPQSYVDDISTMPSNVKELREAGLRIGKALEQISLRSHPDKTEVIVTGRSKRAEAMREKLIKLPAKMQGHPIKVSESGMYLGMKVSQNGHRDSVDMTVTHRVAKAWGRVAEIKAQINDARMTAVGWLKAGVQLIRSVIIPSLTYSADVWVVMNKSTEKFLRDEYKSMVYVILDIPTHTKWTSVLADLCIPNIMCVVDKLRINFVNHTLWRKGDTKLKEMLLEEHRINPTSSMISIIDEVCRSYKIPPVSGLELDKRKVRNQIKLKDEIK